uniref:Uncharacterized protein n=1 Tax=Arundo donax TaxID=35708 RepID=A0A0A8ZM48_ARUDO
MLLPSNSTNFSFCIGGTGNKYQEGQN